MHALSPRLTAYLQSWFDTSTKDKRSKGITVTLTYEQFVGLFHARQIKTLEAAIADNRLRYLQGRENPFAFVLTWRGYEHCQTDVFSADTACICSRQKSKMINSIQVGTRLATRSFSLAGRALAKRSTWPGNSRPLMAQSGLSNSSCTLKTTPSKTCWR